MIYAGGGVVNANASEELVEFATSDRFPVTCTLDGPRRLPGAGGRRAPHPQWLGMLGMHGTRAANYAMDEADLICAVGARFDDRITGKLSEFAPKAKFIHIDVDPAEISKNVPAHIPIVGDAKHVLAKLRGGVPRVERRPGAHGRVVGADRRLAREAPARLRGLDRQRDQAPVHDPGALRGDRGRGDRHKRRGPAPDVDRPVLRLPQAPPLDQLGRARHDGLRPARRDGRRRGLSRPDGLLHRGGRLGADERPGARDVRAGENPHQGVHHEQRLSGHGAPVAGALLGRPLLPR